MKNALVALGFLVGIAFAGELAGRAIPACPGWIDDVHPTLGAAPEDSFARDSDADPWRDLEGRPFARARTARERVLLVGGATARELAPGLEAALAGAEMPIAAREGYGVAQEAILAGRFAPILGATRVVAIDGDELASPGIPGWTREWTWARASIASPLGEVLARRSGLFRLLLVRPPEPLARELVLEDYERGVRALFVLAAAHRLPLAWTCAPPPSLAPEVRARILEHARAAARGRAGVSVFESVAELAREVRTRSR